MKTQSARKTVLFCTAFLAAIAFLGFLAPLAAPNDPLEGDLLSRFAPFGGEYPLGTDQLGRCILSRLIYGIRPTFFLALLTMTGTILLGTFMGVISGYFGGTADEIIMRLVDVMLSFPSQITILAVVGLLGSDLRTVVLVTVLIKWAWYARMIRSSVIKFREQDFIAWSRSIGSGNLYILFRHIIPGISGELAVLATLETGWAVLNISTLSFLGLGVQAPVPEWGAMLSEAKNVMTFNPFQMLPPGLALMSVVLVCNLLGDSLRDLLDVREAGKR